MRGDGGLWLVAGYNVAIAALSLVAPGCCPRPAGATTRGRDLDEQWVPQETAPKDELVAV